MGAIGRAGHGPVQEGSVSDRQTASWSPRQPPPRGEVELDPQRLEDRDLERSPCPARRERSARLDEAREAQEEDEAREPGNSDFRIGQSRWRKVAPGPKPRIAASRQCFGGRAGRAHSRHHPRGERRVEEDVRDQGCRPAERGSGRASQPYARHGLPIQPEPAVDGDDREHDDDRGHPRGPPPRAPRARDRARESAVAPARAPEPRRVRATGKSQISACVSAKTRIAARVGRRGRGAPAGSSAAPDQGSEGQAPPDPASPPARRARRDGGRRTARARAGARMARYQRVVASGQASMSARHGVGRRPCLGVEQAARARARFSASKLSGRPASGTRAGYNPVPFRNQAL